MRFERDGEAYECYFMRDDASACEGLTTEAFSGEKISILEEPLRVPFGDFECVLSKTLESFQTSYYFAGMVRTGSAIFALTFVFVTLFASVGAVFVDAERLGRGEYASIR